MGWLRAGAVYFYVPGTSTPKDTWQDSAQTTLNTNPVYLDANGQATIYGNGVYRQILRDSLGNQIWDQLTTDTLPATGQIPYGVDTGTANSIIVATVTPDITTLNPGQVFSVQIANNPTGPTTLSLKSFGTFSCVTSDDNTFTFGDVIVGLNALFVYTGTVMQLLSPNNGVIVFNAGIKSNGASGSALSNMSPTVACKRTATGVGPNFAIGVVQGQTTSVSPEVEIALNVGLTSDTGAGVAGHESVALYSGLDVAVGSLSAWNHDNITQIESGAMAHAAGLGTPAFVFGLAITMDNLDQDLPTNLAAGGATGIVIQGGGTQTSTFGFLIDSANTGVPQFHQGVTIGANTCQDYSFVDTGGATTSIGIFGNTNQIYGLDTNFMASGPGTPLRIPNGRAILARNAANSDDQDILFVDSNNQLQLGSVQGFAGAICVNNDLLPNIDNTYSLGNTSGPFRYTQVCAVNGTIQTSDVRLKTDIAALPDMLATVMSINPITFRWVDGGMDLVETDVQEERPVMQDEVRTRLDHVPQPDGTVKQVEVQYTVQVPVTDSFPVLNADGQALFHNMEDYTKVVKQPDGSTKSIPARRPTTTTVPNGSPVMHPRVRREKQWVKRMVPTSRPGRRVHWGLQGGRFQVPSH